MTPDDYAKALLAIVVYREARGEGLAGQQAVASVIMNRVAKLQLGSLAQKVVKTITSPNQFSSISILGDTQTIIWPLCGDPCFDIAEAAYIGKSPDNTNGASFYANEENITSSWYKSNIINCPQHPVTVIIGKQTFRK